MSSLPETANRVQPTVTVKVVTNQLATISDIVDAAVVSEQPAATTDNASDAADAAVASQQPAATTDIASNAVDAAVASQQPAAMTDTASNAADAAVASQQPTNSALIEAGVACINRAPTTREAIAFIESLLNLISKDCNKRLKATVKFFFMALFMVLDGRKDGNLVDDLYRTYKMLCVYYHYSPCSRRTVERFLKDYTARIDPDGISEAEDARIGETKKNKRFFNCRLTLIAERFVDAISEQARLGTLDEGKLLLDALREKCPQLNFLRILLLDGSHNRLADNASEVSLQLDGAEPDEAKGLTGTWSRKLHLLLDIVSRGVVAYRITAGTFSEIAVFKQLIEEGTIRKGDVIVADAGYLSAEIIALLQTNGVHFVIKGKSNLNPLVLSYVRYATYKTDLPKSALPLKLAEADVVNESDWLTCADNPKEEWTYDAGGDKEKTEKKFYSALVCSNDEIIDANVCMKGVPMRMVQIYNPTKDRNGDDESPYVYITTNMPADSFSPMDIWALSRGRWSVELSFKALKQFCYMSGWDTDRIGRADFFIMMALASFQMKVLFAQTVQKQSGKTLSMLSSCNIDRINMLAYLGIPHFIYGNVDPNHPLHNAKNGSKTRAKRKEQYELYKREGNAAIIADELLEKAQKARVSRVNRKRLKSLGLLGKLMAYFPVPKVTLPPLPQLH